MLQIKIISYPDAIDVEEAFNNWVNKTSYTVKEVSYSTTFDNGELRHSVLVSYIK